MRTVLSAIAARRVPPRNRWARAVAAAFPRLSAERCGPVRVVLRDPRCAGPEVGYGRSSAALATRKSTMPISASWPPAMVEVARYRPSTMMVGTPVAP